MDTTYFGKDHGVMVLYDSLSKQALFVAAVAQESNALYLQALRNIQAKGTTIQSMTCDGRKGLGKLLPGIPMQLCQFHQVQTLNRYLTRCPKSLAARELRALTLTLKTASQQEFTQALAEWYTRHKTYLNERSLNPFTQKSHYTHKPLRSAYRSLQRNLDKLFTFECYPDLHIQRTTNLLEGRFSDLKRKLRCHQGMNWENKTRFIKDYFSEEPVP